MKPSLLSVLIIWLIASPSLAKFKPTTHRAIKAGEIPVTEPGNLDKAGATYVLTKNISSSTSPIFLGKDITLDLNGYTITYQDGNYTHVPNFSFEEGLKHWDTTNAPGAVVADRSIRHPLVGKNTCLLPAKQELLSSYVHLPVANRSYYATVAVADQKTPISIYVEDETGKSIKCEFQFGNNKRPSCPEINRPSKLGGGIVFAHLHGLKSGKYRVRVIAGNKDCIIDCVDIQPAMDVGISIVDKVFPWAYYKCILDGDRCAFFDYAKKGSTSEPKAGLPRVKGKGTITIKNGTIQSGFDGIRTWAILSSANDVAIHINNIHFKTRGNNANAVSVGHGSLKNCLVECDTPFIIDRHRRESTPVGFIDNNRPSIISDSTFIGGQGSVKVAGKNSIVNNNVFKPKQTVTNHYAVSCDGENTKVFDNIFEPTIGSGIYIYKNFGAEIYGNVFKIKSAPPNNEYGNTDYSTNAIRISDYNAKKGNKKGWCENNRVYNNKIKITAQDYEGADKNYQSMSYAIFMSVGGGTNYVYDNEITINHKNIGSKNSEAYAFYIGGSNQGGEYTGNTITANTTPIWIGNKYGVGKNVLMKNNTIIKADKAKPFPPFKLGYYKSPTKNISIYSTTLKGLETNFEIGDATTGYISEYTWGWTLSVKTIPNATVTISNNNGNEVTKKTANDKGIIQFTLPQYRAIGNKQTDTSKYTVSVGKNAKAIVMNQDLAITLK